MKHLGQKCKLKYAEILIRSGHLYGKRLWISLFSHYSVISRIICFLQTIYYFYAKQFYDWISTGAISLLGRVGNVALPYLVLLLTTEPTNPRLCYDARYLNLSKMDQPFEMDRRIDLPCDVTQDTYQTVPDHKSGITFLCPSLVEYFFSMGCWYLTCHTFFFRRKITKSTP